MKKLYLTLVLIVLASPCYAGWGQAKIKLREAPKWSQKVELQDTIEGHPFCDGEHNLIRESLKGEYYSGKERTCYYKCTNRPNGRPCTYRSAGSQIYEGETCPRRR